MIDYSGPKHPFEFHADEARLMYYVATGGDPEKLTEQAREDLSTLIISFTEFLMEISPPVTVGGSDSL